MAGAPKAVGAFRTIGEVSEETGLPQHILRYWETRFDQLRPVTRAGNRRYYRPDHVALIRRIDTLLNRQGYTIRGVQQVLAGEAAMPSVPLPPADQPAIMTTLAAIRDRLAEALAGDEG